MTLLTKKLKPSLKINQQKNKLKNIKNMVHILLKIFIKDVVIPVIMGGESLEAIELRSKLGFTQYEITLKKESSVLESIIKTFEGEDIKTQYAVLNYRLDLYFHDYKLAVEIDE